MLKYVVSISIVSILISIIFLVIPSGKTNNIVKFTLSFILLAVIIKPLVKINSCNISNTSVNTSIEIQSDFIYYYQNKYMTIIKKDCENICSTLGYKNVKIIVLISNDEKLFFSIEKITINLKNAELTSDNNHIDITKQIKNEISSKYSLKEEQVTIYE